FSFSFSKKEKSRRPAVFINHETHENHETVSGSDVVPLSCYLPVRLSFSDGGIPDTSRLVARLELGTSRA
ncbi:MAG: hypothetical protein ACKVI3_19925, partial [Verrucomicrobiia bacterium]